ncbi:phytosulfokines 3-like [Vicia villosa]|uniref:phytosulfokines 3-like n=1 Tax=Vicia villosa TaxID=3911 RepID=UPI00273AB15C|nr:phytosulfokines 3-like [Vicia villosa]
MRLSFIFRGPLLFIFFLFFSTILSSRPLTSEQGKNFFLEFEGGESLKVMEMENCNIEDEECMQRRMTLEAHLDYIYTQHHKKP